MEELELKTAKNWKPNKLLNKANEKKQPKYFQIKL